MIEGNVPQLVRACPEQGLTEITQLILCGFVSETVRHSRPFQIVDLLRIYAQVLAYLGSRLVRQAVGDLVKIGERLGFVAHRRLGVPVILPNGDNHEGEQHRIEDPDHREFEAGDFIVEGEAVGSPLLTTKKHEADAVGFGDGDDAERQQPRRHLIQEPEHVRRAVRDLELTDEVTLADPQAASAQEIVGGGGVKIEIGQGEVQEIRLTLEANLLAAQLQRDVPVLRTVDVRWLEALYETHRLGDALPERGKARLLVGIGWNFGAGEPRRCALGEVRRKLDLAGEGKHVGGEPPIEQNRLFDLALLGEDFGLFQYGIEILQHGNERRNGSLIHREGHGRCLKSRGLNWAAVRA